MSISNFIIDYSWKCFKYNKLSLQKTKGKLKVLKRLLCKKVFKFWNRTSCHFHFDMNLHDSLILRVDVHGYECPFITFQVFFGNIFDVMKNYHCRRERA